jgi:hypothetical protein
MVDVGGYDTSYEYAKITGQARRFGVTWIRDKTKQNESRLLFLDVKT